MPRTSKRVCQPCRSRKVRCDAGYPSCQRCSRAARSCSWETDNISSVTFRHSKLSALTAAAGRVQNNAPGRGRETTSAETSSQASLSPGWPTQLSPQLSLSNASAEVVPPPGVGTSPASQATAPLILASPSLNQTEPFTATRPQARQDFLHQSLIDISAEASRQALPPLLAESTTQELRHATRKLDADEGELLQFYIANIGPCLDVTSPDRHYTYTVPRLASQCELLLYAVMACSAHVMRLLDPNRTELEGKVEEYQAECVRLLISFLGKFEYAVQEEEVIVTMTILRMLEQYDECHIDRQHHLVPDAFMHMGKDMLSSTLLGGLLQTTFYSYVRTDIRMAILGQCGTRISLDRWPLDEDSPSSDADWANRMTWLLVHAINLCYDSAASGVMPHEQLVSLVEKWKAEVPSSFEPYFHSQGSRDAFPVMRFVCPWHAVGMQFYHASRILLAARRMADQHFRDVLHFNNNMKSEILVHVRMLCAISFSSDDQAIRINGSHLVAMGGRFFTGREEQCRVMDHFEQLQKERAWPIRACLELLNEAWAT